MSLILRIVIGMVIGAILGFAAPGSAWIGLPKCFSAYHSI